MLAIRDIDVFIQASHILRTVSLEVGEREVVCLVGRNGAGKTTTLLSIMGIARPRRGAVRLEGEERVAHRTAVLVKAIAWRPGLFAPPALIGLASR